MPPYRITALIISSEYIHYFFIVFFISVILHYISLLLSLASSLSFVFQFSSIFIFITNIFIVFSSFQSYFHYIGITTVFIALLSL